MAKRPTRIGITPSCQKATASEDQAGKARADNRAWDRHPRLEARDRHS
jgi:hypothetical protein